MTSFLQIFEGTLSSIQSRLERETMDLAEKQTSGPYNAAALEAADHPYAQRHGPRGKNPSTYPPEVLNVDTGVLQASWYTNSPGKQGDGIHVRVSNDATYAIYHDPLRYPLGTMKMIRRAPNLAVERRMERKGEEIVRDEIEQWVKSVKAQVER